MIALTPTPIEAHMSEKQWIVPTGIMLGPIVFWLIDSDPLRDAKPTDNTTAHGESRSRYLFPRVGGIPSFPKIISRLGLTQILARSPAFRRQRTA